MRRRVLPITAAAVLLAGTALTGCTTTGAASISADDCVTPLSPGALSDSIELSGDSADSLRVSLLEGMQTLNSERSLTVKAEDRSRVATEGSVVSGNVAYVDGATGEVLEVSNAFMSGEGQELFLASLTDPFSASLLCSAPGDVVSVVLSEQDSMSFNYLEGNLVLLAEVTEVSAAAAEGRVKALPAGFPAVTTNDEGRPGIVLPPQSAPSETKAAARISGDGPEVTAEQIVVGNVLTVDWNGNLQGNTWDSSVTSFGSESQTQSSFRAALTGFPVGSQVVVVEPGATGIATVSVVDILAAV